MEGGRPASSSATAPDSSYFVKFDPPSNPEMASGAEVITTKFLYAFGYNVPENYMATHSPRVAEDRRRRARRG